jgi:arylsulfatase A-like enzyme
MVPPLSSHLLPQALPPRAAGRRSDDMSADVAPGPQPPPPPPPGAGWHLACVAGLLVAAKLALLGLLAVDSTARAPGGRGGLGGLGSGWALVALVDPDARVLGLLALVELAAAAVRTRARAGGARRGLPRTRRALRWLGALGWGGLAVYTAVNVPVARVMGTPLTYTILRTVGGALSDSIRVYFTAANLVAVAAVLGVAAGLPVALARLRQSPRRRLALATGGLLALVGVLALGPRARQRAGAELGGLPRNAVYTLVATTLAQHVRTRAPAVLPPLPPAPSPALDLSELQGAARGRSVIWVVLESTAAQYLRPFGTRADPMPTVTELAREGVVFDAAYAAYPESIKGLFSLLCATAPAAHTPAERYTAEKVPCSPLAEQLRAVGYRTAMFHSGWFAYLGMQGIVERRGFDVLADAGTIGGTYATSFGVDEQTTVQRLLRFIDEARGETRGEARGETRPGRARPFFAMYLPIAGHHPYSVPGPEERPRPFSGSAERELYLNDLAFGDQALAALRAALRQRGLDEQILWIVSGDHGEAFQQHPGNFAHTLYLYDENVRVPLIVTVPGHRALAANTTAPGALRTAPQVASLIDVAPTLMALLGLRPPAVWQGRSLLQPPAETAGEPVARFLTDHGLLQLGLRHGPWKFIDEVETGRGRLFDLRHDPGEQHDLAAAQPERARAYRGHLRAWADAQRARLQDARALAD